MALRLENIKVQNFRNHKDIVLSFSDGFNTIVGNNGAGKTSLLEAISYLLLTKSFLTSSEKTMLNVEADFFLLEAGIDEKKVRIAYQEGKKQIFVNEEKIQKLSDYYGLFNAVWICPNDIDLIQGNSEGRRKFLDRHIAQINEQYLMDLLGYKKYLQRRNVYLKSLGNSTPDHNLLDIYDEKLIYLGSKIAKSRQVFINDLIDSFRKNYKKISEIDEQVNIIYESQALKDSFSNNLKQNRFSDIAAKRTLLGVHKDEVIFYTLGMHTKIQASQGQIKNFVVALKCAVFQLIMKKKKQMPILLIDDLNDRLDLFRLKNFIAYLSNFQDAQIIITDTRAETLSEIFSSLKLQNKLIRL